MLISFKDGSPAIHNMFGTGRPSMLSGLIEVNLSRLGIGRSVDNSRGGSQPVMYGINSGKYSSCGRFIGRIGLRVGKFEQQLLQFGTDQN
jgi:hypothetical protein